MRWVMDFLHSSKINYSYWIPVFVLHEDIGNYSFMLWEFKINMSNSKFEFVLHSQIFRFYLSLKSIQTFRKYLL